MKGEVSTEFIKQSLDYFHANTPRIEKCLDELSEEEVWRSPNAESNSIGNLILHLCGNISQWIISGIGGEEDDRERDEEFVPDQNISKSDLLDRLKKTTSKASNIMSSLDDRELLRVRRVQCYDMSAIGIIIHVVEHYSYHTGQIAYWTKAIRNADLGFYAGQDLNETG